MTREELCVKRDEALSAFSSVGRVTYCEPYGNGHINDTFLTVTETGKRYILQRINHFIFKDPRAIMKNICAVTEHIRSKAETDKERASLVVVPTELGETCFSDSIGSWWRMYEFCEGTETKEKVTSEREFVDCAEAFGRFQCALADFDASTLTEAIPDFHNTPKRYENLLASIERDPLGRAAAVKAEIDFVKEREEFLSILENARLDGTLPLRVTHNDTKLNNILFDGETHKPVCVIDLDTVMPGYSVNDFGDSIRFGANTAAEDETDLSKISLDLSLYRAYADGFLRGCEGKLTETEIRLLPVGAKMMTLECGIRFLTDHIDGDTYFRISREGHNLDRARNQFALVADMEKKWSEMQLD